MFYYKNYVLASSLEEAYNLNQKKNNKIVAGNGWLKLSNNQKDTLIDLSNLGLDQIVEDDNQYKIGAMVTLRELEKNISLNRYTNNALKDSLKSIVGTQFRNTVTIGGSLWGRFGFSDPLTLFLALDTYVELYNKGIVPLSEFVNYNYDNDILINIIVKKEKINVSYEAFRNQATDFPVLTCALSKVNDKYRLVIGARPEKAQVIIIENDQISDYKKLANMFKYSSNMRASKEYRLHLAEVLIKRNKEKLGE